MSMNPEVKALWLEALRSGEYEQGRDYLRQGDQFCCLGVLCEIAVEQGVIPPAEPDEDGYPIWHYGYDYTFKEDDGAITMNPPEKVVKWAGLPDRDGSLPEHIEYERPGATYSSEGIMLTELNDRAEFTFEQIADVIEEQF